jgi:hypothetical protein
MPHGDWEPAFFSRCIAAAGASALAAAQMPLQQALQAGEPSRPYAVLSGIRTREASMNTRQIPAPRSLLLALLALTMLLLSGCATGRLAPDDQQRFAGKTFVITGASSGIGRGLALELAAMRANVVLVARRVAVLQQVAYEARAAGGAALVVGGDVSRRGRGACALRQDRCLDQQRRCRRTRSLRRNPGQGPGPHHRRQRQRRDLWQPRGVE